MEIDMLLEISDLCVGLVAAFDRADIRFLASVHTKMIKNVLDLLEEFPAARVIAGKHRTELLRCHTILIREPLTYHPMRRLLGIFQLTEKSGRWDREAVCEDIEFECDAREPFDSTVVWEAKIVSETIDQGRILFSNDRRSQGNKFLTAP